MARIFIRDLALRTLIGVNDWEKDRRQDVLINIEFDYDSTMSGLNDDMEQAVDYRFLTDQITDYVERGHFSLVEFLAHQVLGILLEEPRITWAAVTVDKPRAQRFSKSIGVRVESSKS